jgi:hypothetical protein
MDYLKAIDRVRKLLRLAEGAGTEAEAASAAAQAADLMAQHALSEAEIRLEDTSKAAEPIIESGVDGDKARRKRVAWQSTIAEAVAKSYGCKMFWRGKAIQIYGRESSVQATSYTCAYLYREVDRLCEQGWEREGSRESPGVVWSDREYKYVERDPRGAAKAWRNAFRNGAANTIAVRLRESIAERRDAARVAAREATVKHAESAPVSAGAMVLVERDQAEVDASYERVSSKFRTASAIGQTSSRGGYESGRAAGGSISLGGKRAGLGAGQGRLK